MDDVEVLPDLPRLDWVQNVRDPIWGEIPITEIERRVIQTGAFYRLRGIKQLGFAYLAFPGAMHTRFEHSLGVMHATDMLLKMMRKDEENPVKVNSIARQVLRLAALLHDIGHPPFSHAMEDLFTYYPDLVARFYQDLPDSFHEFMARRGIGQTQIHRHEFFTEYIICTDEGLRQVLLGWLREVLGQRYAPEDVPRRANGMIDDVIAQLAVGKAVSREKLLGDIAAPIPIFRSIMSGDIDADKIDYLMRDNYYCGLPHIQDLNSLRQQLVLDRDGLKIERGALRFVQSLLLARYRLITQVHQEPWGLFATAKAIELLDKMLNREEKPGQLLADIFTRWNDSELLDYLVKGDPNFQEILTTYYPLDELARLEHLEIHPNIRACIDILSDPAGNRYIPRLQKRLCELTGNVHLIVQVQKIKPPEFSMKLVGGGYLLGDAILRGVSEESIAGLQLVVYGADRLDVNLDALKQTNLDLLPCESCELVQECVGNLKNAQKRLLAELVVHTYREIVEECGAHKIIVIDFLMLIMERVHKICKGDGRHAYPTRQDFYAIAKRLVDSAPHQIQILGALDLSEEQITSSFHQQLRKYEQLGLIAYSREIRRLEREDQTEGKVFRFDRRFRLSRYGLIWLDKIRSCFGRAVKQFKEYEKCWDQLSQALDEQEEFVKDVLQRSAIDERSAITD